MVTSHYVNDFAICVSLEDACKQTVYHKGHTGNPWCQCDETYVLGGASSSGNLSRRSDNYGYRSHDVGSHAEASCGSREELYRRRSRSTHLTRWHSLDPWQPFYRYSGLVLPSPPGMKPHRCSWKLKAELTSTRTWIMSTRRLCRINNSVYHFDTPD